MHIPYSEACERNKDPILTVLSPLLDQAKSVLEIGSGTAQHAVHFAAAKPHVRWQTSDQAHYLSGIHAQLLVAKIHNVMAPIELDVNQAKWLKTDRRFDLVYSANTLHIMSANDVVAFFDGLANVINTAAYLVVYGPFKYRDQFTSESNAAFDERLRARGEGSSIKDVEWVDQLAKEQGFALQADHPMPANNQCLVWRHES